MAKDTTDANCKKYGVPLYGASWVPPTATRSDPKPTPDGEDEPSGDESPPSTPPIYHVVLAGGGGEGRSGIPNALLLVHFDFASSCLADQPVGKLGTGSDLPYRMAVHPGGDGVICSLPKSCRLFEWDAVKGTDIQKLGLKLSDKSLDKLDDVGQQLALNFNNEGSVLALGGEDGKLRVFKWPSMEIMLDEANAHASVKDLDFSPDGKFLVSVGSGGPGRVWDVTSSTPVVALSKENDEIFGFCRFSLSSDKNPVLYITAMRGQSGSILKWDTSSWKRVSSKHIVRDPVSAFNVSADGKLLAIGTIQGDVLIINSANMHVQNVVRKAHLGLVTALKFSQDSRALVTASLDSSARVTVIKQGKKNGLSLLVIILVILLAIALYYAKAEGGEMVLTGY
ncbi:SEC12-like protein [Actinidia chinensis var. chinensis]|uniref:SEC12-like protein n=1 Tax=Actinidia chinensis var. chinensis TaxID=1590841 RepID=A0A2R6PBD9_ACTCC|nr:SEC12-like protein [Actinidia chinensis var. chinensis]